MADEDVVIPDDNMAALLAELDSPDEPDSGDLKPGDEGYVEPPPPEELKLGDEGYVLKEGDEGYVAPTELSPGDDGYVAPVEESAPVAPAVDNELELLKRTVREQSEQINKLVGGDESLRKQLTDSNLLTPADEKPVVADPVVQMRDMQVAGYAETMRLTPEFKDIDEVCSQDHVDSIMSAAAMHLVNTQGMSAADAQAAIHKHVWDDQPNPYKYLYDTVKKYHPQYKEAASAPAETDEAKAIRLKTEADKKDPTKQQPVAPTIADIPGGGDGDKGGWTAAIIDALPEDKIGSVPAAVYEKYMAGDLK